MVKEYKIVYYRDECIGATTCTEFFKKFKMAKDGKADLKGSKKQDGDFILEISEKELEEVMQAARSCPVNVIHIYDGNKKLI